MTRDKAQGSRIELAVEEPRILGPAEISRFVILSGAKNLRPGGRDTRLRFFVVPASWGASSERQQRAPGGEQEKMQEQAKAEAEAKDEGSSVK